MLQLKKTLFQFVALTFIYAETIPFQDNPLKEKLLPSIQWLESDEYNFLCDQIYMNAKQNLTTKDLNKTFSVLLEQDKNSSLPAAIIVDIDETILLNLAFRKETMSKIGTFSYPIWKKHIALKTAIPISGALEYLNYLAQNNIKTIYISNRSIEEENDTFILLKKLGFPINSKEDILLQNEKKDWVKNKTSRRIYIGKRYKIIQVFGDNLRDFTETNDEALAHKDIFGKSWFLLPNPLYGNWGN